MRKLILILTGAVLLQLASQSHATNVNIILASDIRPGIYGRVDIGDTRPRVVYSRPIVIHEVRQYRNQPPIYLNVPPGHARNWSQHCRYYDSCGRKVYFVRSREYDPDYRREMSRHRYEEQRHHDHGRDRHDRHDGRRDYR